MKRHSDIVVNNKGVPLGGAKILVRNLDNSVATLYLTNSTTGGTAENPVPADSRGQFSFYAPDGRYTLEVYLNDVLVATYPDSVLLEDQAAKLALLVSSVQALNDLAAINGEALVAARDRLDILPTSAGAAAVGFNKTGGGTVQAQLDMLYYGTANIRDTQYAGGALGDGTTDDTAAIQAAINSGKRIVYAPPGTYAHGNLTITGPVRFIGAGRGYGVNALTSFKYTGSGKAIHVTSAASYVYLEHFSLKNAGTGTDGIFIDGSHVYVTNVGLTDNLNVGFVNGISTGTSGPFDLIFSQVYCQGNGVGLNIPTGITIQAINCWLDQNGTNAIIGSAGYRVHGFSMIGGVNQLLGVGYFGNTSETTTSIGFDVVNAGAFVYDNVYSEANGGGIVGSEGQRSIRIRQCKGAKISAYFYGANRATAAITLDAGAKGIVVSGGYGINIDGYIIEAAAGAVYEVGMIAKVNCLGTIDRAWVPVATSMTVVNGTGGVTYIGNWERVGDRVFFDISVLPTGTATSNAVGNTTYFALDAAMPTPVAAAVCNVVDGSVNSLGCGQVFTNGRVYPPTWSARNVRVDISGSYLAAPAT